MLFVLEFAYARILAIEAVDQLLRFLRGHVELQRERTGALAGKRRKVDHLADLALRFADCLDRQLEHRRRGLDVDVLVTP